VIATNAVAGANRVGILFDAGLSFGSHCQLIDVGVGGSLHYGVHFNTTGSGYTSCQILGGTFVSGANPNTGSIGLYMQKADTNHIFGLNVENWETGIKTENTARFNHIMARMEGNATDWETTRFSDFNFITGSWMKGVDGAEFNTVISQSSFQGADMTNVLQNQRTTIMHPVLESSWGVNVAGGRHSQIGGAINFRVHPKAAIDTRLSVKGGNILELNNGTSSSGAWLTIPQIKSLTGTRYVCVDTTGKLVSQTTACSGT
jgi:hypothetical protein